MTFEQFKTQVIDDGLAEVREVYAEAELQRLRQLLSAALRYNGHLADCPQDGPCEALCQDFRAALSEEPGA